MKKELGDENTVDHRRSQDVQRPRSRKEHGVESERQQRLAKLIDEKTDDERDDCSETELKDNSARNAALKRINPVKPSVNEKKCLPTDPDAKEGNDSYDQIEL